MKTTGGASLIINIQLYIKTKNRKTKKKKNQQQRNAHVMASVHERAELICKR